MSISHAKGRVKKAFGNLVEVHFEGHIRQGEIASIHVDGNPLKAEVIEILGDFAKLQVYEDTQGIQLDSPVEFTGDLLEASLGPGLISSIFDGLQNPLKEVADAAGLFLPKGLYLSPLNREKKWEFEPKAVEGQRVKRGDILAVTHEGRFEHKIMVPFSLFDSYQLAWIAPKGSYTVEEVIAKVKDESGVQHSITMMQKWPIKIPLQEGAKVKPTEMMTSGLRTIDTQFPVMKGGTFCSPGPFGAGKTVLQHHLSKFSSVDLVILVACGERAGEVVEILREFPHLIDPHTNETLMARTIIICNTSSMPVAARESSIYMGMTIAEYYRQMGLDVLLLADSTSRWAQALREMSGRLEEIPGEEAFPAYLSSRIADFYERSGVISLTSGERGSITTCGAVSPAGGNFEEPVTQATLSVVGAFLGLSRERSDARRYPAIDPLLSWSKYIDQVGKELNAKLPGWGQMVKKAGEILYQGNEIGKRMEVVGEEGIAIEDIVTYLKSELYDFCYLQQNAFDVEDSYCPLERQVSLFALMDKIFNASYKFTSHEEAREFFMNLSNEIKNMNYMSFTSEHYMNSYRKVEEMLRQQP